jgi:putative addiction module killer protein
VVYKVEIYSADDGHCPFLDWMARITPVDERRIRKRLRRIESGNLGDYKSIGEGVSELRFFFGSGYRIYFGFNGKTIVLLLCGGDKSSQTKDIEKAKIIWREIQND